MNKKKINEKLNNKELKKEKKEKGIEKGKFKEKQEKEGKLEQEEKKESEEFEEEKIISSDIESLEELTTQPRVVETAFQVEEFFEPASRAEFVAPVLIPTEETREPLEETTRNIPTPTTSTTQTSSPYMPSQEKPYSVDEYETASVYETREGRRREERARFDIREGLVADASKVIPAFTPITMPSTQERARSPEREELEHFAEEQRKYKEKIEEDRRRRKTLR